MTDRIDVDPVRSSLCQAALLAALGPLSYVRKVVFRSASAGLFRYFNNPSADQIVRVASGRKAEAAKLALPANPSR